MRATIAALATLVLAAATPATEKTAYLELARLGWNYQLRTTMVGRDLSIPVHINGRDLSGASLCIVGERPHPHSAEIIDAFGALARRAFGKPLTVRYAGREASACGTGRTVVLRLYSGHPPHRELSADLGWMNDIYGLGLPRGRDYTAGSPAMGQTFFGRRGQGTHIMVKQPALPRLGRLEAAFYKSILVEELFQSFTFGMDILHIDRNRPFRSKLQEVPLYLDRMSWSSRGFMRALLKSNPGGLCPFDVFMLHAVALSPVDQTVEPSFIEFIDSEFEALMALADETLADPGFAPLMDGECRGRDL